MSQSELLTKTLAQQYGIVLLYHGLFDAAPPELGAEFHNVSAEHLFQQLEWLSRHFRFVSVDEYCASSQRAGLAAVTADDGYQSVLDNSMQVFEALEIPITLFLNRSFLEGGIFWRDKVRTVIAQGRVDEFERRFAGRFKAKVGQSFYRYTKDPQNNSIEVESALNEFLEGEVGLEQLTRYYLKSTKPLLAHPLLSYGSHSVNHYVLSSLSEEQQWREIEDNWRFLNTFKDIQRTAAFSIPFGGERDYNDATLRLARDAGHSAALLSRGVITKAERHTSGDHWTVDRFMVRAQSPSELVDVLVKGADRSVRR